MALTRKFLSALGIDAEKIDEIITAHVDTVNSLKEERDVYKNKSEKYDETVSELERVNRELDSLNNDSYKIKYDAIKEEYDNFKTETIKNAEKASKTSAFTALLNEIGISEKIIDKVVKISDIDAIELDDDGKIVDIENLSNNIKNEWSDFIIIEEKRGSNPDNPPGNNGGNTFATMSLVDKMSYANAHPDSQEVIDWLKN